jgi:pimeloyl-ACP methyl ester carboxylesterase
MVRYCQAGGVHSLPPGLFVIDHHQGRGAGSGSPRVVLVHGSLDRGASFARVVRRLADLDVVSYDRRGYHRSRHALPLARSLDDHVADLLAVVGDGPAVVVGHSYGGAVALGAATESPAIIRAVGAYEPPLPWEPWWPTRSRASFTDQEPGVFAEGFFRRIAGDDAWEHLSAQRQDERRADGPALVAELSELRREEAPFDFGSITVPTVLGRGERSLEHHRQAVEVLGGLVPGAQIVEFTGARHGAHLSHPDAFADFVQVAVARSTADHP